MKQESASGEDHQDTESQEPIIAGSVGKTQGGQDPPGGPGITKVTKVTVKIGGANQA